MRRDVDSEERVRELIDQTRTRMGDTIEELGHRLNPDRIENEVKTRAKREFRGAKDAARTRMKTMMNDMEDQVNDAGHSIVDTIRDNPIPSAMVGVGLAWLMTNRRNGESREVRRLHAEPESMYASPVGYQESRYASRYETEAPLPFEADRPAGGSLGDEAAGRAHEMGDKAREARDRVEQKATETANRARHAADDAVHRAQDTAHRVQQTADDAMHRAQDTARDVKRRAEYQAHRVEERVRENPLAAGAVALALGFAAGMVTPETRREHRAMGATRDRLMEKAGPKLRDARDTLKHAAEDAVTETAKEAVREMRGGSEDSTSPDSDGSTVYSAPTGR